MNDTEFFQQFQLVGEETLKKWNVPSISLGVIKDGKVIYTTDFGYANIEKQQVPNSDTLYQIGSCSKAFTAAVICKLVDEKLLDLDTPIRNYVPEIRFTDEHLNEALTLRDLLSHRWGMPRHEFSWYGSDFTREELVLNLRYLETNKELRETFQYSNHGFMLAGYIAERVSNKKWEQLVQQYILDPLNMPRTFAYLEDVENDGNHAQPYTKKEINGQKTLVACDYYRCKPEDKSKGIGAPFGPAGSLTSCINDMLKWVQFHLDNGKVNGEQIISQEMMNEIHHPQMLLDAGGPTKEFCEFNTYGFGWNIQNYRGHKLIDHSGGIDGFTTYTSFMPKLKMGIVAFCNIYAEMPHFALAKIIYDHFLGIEDLQKADRWFDIFNKAAAANFNFITYTCGKQVENTTPTHSLESYTGTYHKDGYRDIVIDIVDGKLTIHYFGNSSVLTHYHYDSFWFEKICDDLPDAIPLIFTMNVNGGDINGLQVPFLMEPNTNLVVFKKI